VFNGGLNFDEMSRRSHRPIQTLTLLRQTESDRGRQGEHRFFARQQGNQLAVFAPRVSKPLEKLRPQKIGRVVESAQADKGWDNVPDAQARQLQTKFKQQSEGFTPEKFHAKPVTEKELRAVPENLKPVATPPLSETVTATPTPSRHGDLRDAGRRTREQFATPPQTPVGGTEEASPTPTPAGRKKLQNERLQQQTTPAPTPDQGLHREKPFRMEQPQEQLQQQQNESERRRGLEQQRALEMEHKQQLQIERQQQQQQQQQQVETERQRLLETQRAREMERKQQLQIERQQQQQQQQQAESGHRQHFQDQPQDQHQKQDNRDRRSGRKNKDEQDQQQQQ
jgi:hypothetical protein